MHGQWLREQRQARSWSVPQMGRKLREAAAAASDILPSRECLQVMIHRWEDDRSGISERYRLHYCQAFQIPADQFGQPSLQILPDADPDPAPPVSDSASRIADGSAEDADVEEVDRGHHGDAGGREPLLPVPDRSVGGLLLATARESSDRALDAERRGIGPVTLERFSAAVSGLAREAVTGEPLSLFFRMRQARDDVQSVVGSRSWPGDQEELFFLLGWVNALMADAALQAGSVAAAEQLALSALGYAEVIGDARLVAWLRLELAMIAFWAGSPRTCMEQAALGLGEVAAGPVAAWLHLARSRAAGRLGDVATARSAFGDAGQVHDEAGAADRADSVSVAGGLPAAYHAWAGAALLEIPGAEGEAAAELERAVTLYADARGPGDRGEHDEMIARVDLAVVRVRAGEVEVARVAVGPVLALPCSRRISALRHGFTRVRAELAAAERSPEVVDLDVQAEQFCSHTIADHLADIPGERASCAAV